MNGQFRQGNCTENTFIIPRHVYTWRDTVAGMLVTHAVWNTLNLGHNSCTDHTN